MTSIEGPGWRIGDERTQRWTTASLKGAHEPGDPLEVVAPFDIKKGARIFVPSMDRTFVVDDAREDKETGEWTFDLRVPEGDEV